MDKQFIRDLLDFWASAILLICMLIITKKGWAGRNMLILVFISAVISWYLLSGLWPLLINLLVILLSKLWLLDSSFIVDYNWNFRTIMNTIFTIVGFYFWLYVVDKETFFEAFDFVKNNKLFKKKEGNLDDNK